MDDETEKEYHIVELNHDEFTAFGNQELEVIHDNENKKSYYKVSRNG